MKKLILSAASLLLVLGSCQNEMENQTLSNGLDVVSASIESQNSRLAVSYDHATNIFGLSWSENDAFKAFGGNSTSAEYTWTSDNYFQLSGSSLESPQYGIYPSSSSPSISGNTVTMTLNAAPSVSAINLPMWAATEDGTSYAFKHLAAGLRIDTKSIPAGYNTLIVEASNAINGTFTADLSAENPVLAFYGTLTDANKKVTVTFDAAATGTKDQVFYIPLPAGTYETLTVTISDGSNTKELKKWSNLTILRGKMYYTTAVIDASTIAAVNQALANASEVPVTVNMPEAIDASAGAIEIPDNAKEVTMNFATAPTTTDANPLIINQNHEVASGEAISELNITMPAGAQDLYTTIDAPTTTATLNGGEYAKVTATTATNTLIIKSNVTITSLIIEGGNVIIEEGATVTDITNKVGATITYKKIVNDVATLTEAVGNNYYGIVALGADITMSDILVIGRNMILDGNGYTLTSSAGRAINVSNANGVTIKNLTIKASGERAINIIQGSTNVTIDNVTATAANYTVNVAGSTSNAKLAIKNSTLDGLCTVNISSEGADVTVDNSTINCNDKNTTEGESYAALALNKEAVNGKIVATNTTINVAEGSDSFKGRNAAEDGTVTIDGSTKDVIIISVVITYPGSSYYHGFATVANAVEFAKEGDVITLIRDINISEAITVNKSLTIDLNGKTIAQTSSTPVSMITNSGNLTIKDGKDSGKIAFTFNGTVDAGKAANTISNRGTLLIEGGEISNTGTGSQIGYAIDNYNGATLQVNGGNITASGSSYYDGIRLFCGSNETTVTVNNGKISSIWAQNPSANKATEVKGTVIINGGEVGTTYYENYTTVKVKTGVKTTVTPYGVGSNNFKTATEGEYTVYSFAQSN